MIHYETTQVILEISIQYLCLAIGLRMISAAVGQQSSLEFKYLPPKTTHKDGVPV